MKANDIRRGIVIIHNGTPFRVLDFHHHTPGNWRAHVQTKLRNVLTGVQTEVRFSSTEEIHLADVLTFKATFLYSDDTSFHFMNAESFEEIGIRREVVGDAMYYFQEQMEVEITTHNGEPIGVELPQTVVLTVVETAPELKGATASNSPKPAKTDTGLQLNVPPFIKQGERIIVSTAEGKYLSRAD